MTRGGAEYYDGRTARPHAAEARLEPPRLLVLGEDGAALAHWPIADIRVVDRSGGGLRLARGTGEARLVLPPGEAAEALASAVPRPRRRVVPWAAGGVAVALALAALWLAGPRLADAAASAVPDRVAGLIGEAAVGRIAASAATCAAPAGQAAVDALAARLAAAAGTGAPRVSVVDRAEVNAFAAPGGRVVVLRGLIDRAQTPDEFAGVLAHEIGHHARNHPLRGLVRASGLGLLVSVATGGSDAAGFAAMLATLSNSRAFEREADADGARVLSAAGLPMEGLRRFLERMEEQQGGAPQLPPYLSTHPSHAERVRNLPPVPAGAPAALTPEAWQAVRAICR